MAEAVRLPCVAASLVLQRSSLSPALGGSGPACGARGRPDARQHLLVLFTLSARSVRLRLGPFSGTGGGERGGCGEGAQLGQWEEFLRRERLPWELESASLEVIKDVRMWH